MTHLIPSTSNEYIAKGILPEILHELSKILNFTYTVYKPSHGKWGTVHNNGSWNGLVRDLINETYDIGKK